MQPSARLFVLAASLAIACGLAACGQSPSDPTDPEVPAPPAPVAVPLDLPELALDAECVALGDDERVVGVASEGALWIATDLASVFRVLTRDGVTTVDLGTAPTVVRPWTETQAAFAVGTRLFVREGEGPLNEVGWPRELGPITDLCGDPRRDGAFVIAAGEGEVPAGLYRRAGGEWWRWTPPSGSFGPGMALVDVAGACTADDDRAWLRSATALYAMRDDALHTFDRVERVAIDRHVGVAAASAGKLLFLRGTEWKETRFEAGALDALAGTAGHLWVRVGDRLHHYADGAFSRAVHGVPGAIEAMYPDAAGGVWLATDGQVCHAAPSDAWQVEGIRPFERVLDAELALRVIGAESMRVDVDGESVHDGANEATIALGAPGWHRVDVRVGDRARRFDVLRIDRHVPTWEEDVRPIAEAHCGGSACHGADRDEATRPALADYESWVDLADTIRHRVGVVGDMPPPTVRDGWTADEVTTVVAWIAAGMEERDASE